MAKSSCLGFLLCFPFPPVSYLLASFSLESGLSVYIRTSYVPDPWLHLNNIGCGLMKAFKEHLLMEHFLMALYLTTRECRICSTLTPGLFDPETDLEKAVASFQELVSFLGWTILRKK